MTLTINKACKQALLLGERPEGSREQHTKGNACASPLATRFTRHSKWRACSQAAINIVRRIKCVSPKRQKTRIRKYFSNYEFSYSYVLCIHVLCI